MLFRSEAGFVADLAATGSDGLHLALHGEYDLVILDVMLPELDGWQVLASLRRRGLEMPVLFLTARDQVEDRVKGLELGADDYLVKPFSLKEVEARLTAMHRRSSGRVTPRLLECGQLTLDPKSMAVTFAGNDVKLPPRSEEHTSELQSH